MIFIFLLLIILGTFTFLSLKNPKLGITILFALLPTYLVRFSLFNIPSTLLECFILITIGIWIAHRRAWMERHPNEQKNLTIHINAPEVFIAFIFIAAFLSTIMAPNLPSALGILKAYFIEPFLLMLVVQSTMTTQKDKESIWNSLIASASFIGLLAILQVLTHIGIPPAWITENRATSLYPYPNAVGLFLAPIVAFSIISLAQDVIIDRSSSNLRSLAYFFHGNFSGIFTAYFPAPVHAIPSDAASKRNSNSHPPANPDFHLMMRIAPAITAANAYPAYFTYTPRSIETPPRISIAPTKTPNHAGMPIFPNIAIVPVIFAIFIAP